MDYDITITMPLSHFRLPLLVILYYVFKKRPFVEYGCSQLHLTGPSKLINKIGPMVKAYEAKLYIPMSLLKKAAFKA